MAFIVDALNASSEFSSALYPLYNYKSTILSHLRQKSSFYAADMGTTQFFLFESTWSQKVLIRPNSWLTMVLQELIQISWRLKMDFWKLIKIDSQLQKIQGYFDSNQLMTQKNPGFWLKRTHD